MVYSDFTTLTKVREAFGLTIEESINLFTDTPEVLPSSHLQTTLGEAIESIYGAVTTGTDWKFLKLSDKTIWIDKRDYFINEVSYILGILTTPFKAFYSIEKFR
jgi:hypothetical protein